MKPFSKSLRVSLLLGTAALLTQSAWATVDASMIDATVSPCQNFYQYACGEWIKRTEIPADRAQWTHSFSEIDESNQKTLRQILEGYAGIKAFDKLPSNPYSDLLGQFYGSCMDEKSIDAEGLKGLKEYEDSLADDINKKDWPHLLAKLHSDGIDVFFGVGSQQDYKNPDEMIAAVDQGGLSMPDRDYYLKKDPATKRIQRLYMEHVQKMLRMAGSTAAEAKAEAKIIYNVEKKLAQKSMSRVERRDPQKVYHRMKIDELKQLMPALDWKQYFTDMGYSKIESLNVADPDFFKALHVVKLSPKEITAYVDWHVLQAMTPALPKRFVDETFHYSSSAFTGQKKLQDRWKRCVGATDGLLGFALGRAFVDVAYGKEGKELSEEMIKDVERSMDKTLHDVSWLDDATRKEAFKKLNHIMNKVGYPSKWRSYDGIKLTKNSYLQNRVTLSDFNFKYEMDKIGKPVDRTEWDMTPPTVNAYYDPSLNEMVFPAGIFQPPFFSKSASASENYGGIGMVMGHELTHGFDDQGRQFDENGALKDWWTKGVAEQFKKRGKCVVNQYSSYEVQKGVHLNGKLTLGENIADLGGIRLGYAALERHAKDKDVKLSDQDKKDYFLAFAQAWCTKTQPALERLKVTIDPHSAPRFRVNGPLSDFETFSTVFGCKAGDAMDPKDRCQVW